jgi:hypothetical protein
LLVMATAGERFAGPCTPEGLRKRDPRVYVWLSIVMLEFDDTLVPGRRRERVPMRALARLGHLLRLPA